MSPTETKILTPLRIGRYAVANRVIMAPLVRARCDDDRAPTDLVVTHYVQRASAGLIITEGTHISEFSVTRKTASAHYTEKQHDRWSRVVSAVHAAGGIIFQQLYHVGRKALLSTLPPGQLPIAPSAIAATGGILTRGVLEPFPVPRALKFDEIAGVVDQFRRAVENAQRAGFDGVEIQAANGFLVDQFLRDGANKRADEYGGSIENRARFLLEVIDAVIGVIGADRVGVRLSPHFRADGITDTDPVSTFQYVARELDRRQVAYLHILEGLERDDHPFEQLYLRMQKKRRAAYGPASNEPYLAPLFRENFRGPLILNGGYEPKSAIEMVEAGKADAVSFGRLFISNPDLPERIRVGAELTEPDPETFFAGGPRGYIDYPFLDSSMAVSAVQAGQRG